MGLINNMNNFGISRRDFEKKASMGAGAAMMLSSLSVAHAHLPDDHGYPAPGIANVLT